MEPKKQNPSRAVGMLQPCINTQGVREVAIYILASNNNECLRNMRYEVENLPVYEYF